MASYLVTGAARGLGLELVRALSKKPAGEVSVIFATIRSSPPPALQDLKSSQDGRVVLVSLEVTNSDSIASAVRQVQETLGGRGLDVLINNAAVNAECPGGIEMMNNLRTMLEVNVEAVHNITAAFLPLLRESARKTVLNMSSITGSITLAERWMIAPHHAYKISKAALNSMTRIYAFDLASQGFTFFAVSPGWVRTDQGGPYADLDAETSATATLDLLSRDREALNGRFLNIHVPGWENATGLHKYDGFELPW